MKKSVNVAVTLAYSGMECLRGCPYLSVGRSDSGYAYCELFPAKYYAGFRGRQLYWHGVARPTRCNQCLELTGDAEDGKAV